MRTSSSSSPAHCCFLGKMKKTNIVIFNPDQFRADALGHLGNAASRTPVMDALARTDAVSFRNAFCQNPVCTPSRCSFMSGWYPHVRGHRTMHHMMRPGEPVLLRTLKENGWFVWWGGKNDLVPGQNPLDAYCDVRQSLKGANVARDPHGFDAWRGEPGNPRYYSFYAGVEPGDANGDSPNSDRLHVLGACDFIRNHKSGQPFCVYLPLGSPHPPYYCEQKWLDKIGRVKLPPRIPAPDFALKPSILKGIFERQNLQGLSESDWDDIRQTYLAMCARSDHHLGMVLDAFRDAGAYDDTAVFVISDHGDFTGDYGLVEKTQNTFEDCLTNTPFIVKPPRRFPVKPRVSEALVENIDMCATIEAMTGIAPMFLPFSLNSLLGLINANHSQFLAVSLAISSRIVMGSMDLPFSIAFTIIIRLIKDAPVCSAINSPCSASKSSIIFTNSLLAVTYVVSQHQPDVEQMPSASLPRSTTREGQTRADPEPTIRGL